MADSGLGLRDTVCVICGEVFQSRTAYGLCAMHFNRDTAKEYDRVETAKVVAKKDGVRATLTLVEWLSVLSDFSGRCAYCRHNRFTYLWRHDPRRALELANVVPICEACSIHKERGWAMAERRVQAYLEGRLAPRRDVIHEDGDE